MHSSSPGSPAPSSLVPPPRRFVNTAVHVDGDRLASVSRLDLTRTLGRYTAASTPSDHSPRSSDQKESRAPSTAPSCSHGVGGVTGDINGAEARSSHPIVVDEDSEAMPFLPPTRPDKRRIVGACFHELKARAMAVHAAAMAESDAAVERDRDPRQEADAASAKAAAVKKDATISVPYEARRGGRDKAIDSRIGGCSDDGRRSMRGPGEDTKAVSVMAPWVMPLVTRPEGFLIEVEGVVLRAGHGKALGKRMDGLVQQAKALVIAVAATPGRSGL